MSFGNRSKQTRSYRKPESGKQKDMSETLTAAARASSRSSGGFDAKTAASVLIVFVMGGFGYATYWIMANGLNRPALAASAISASNTTFSRLPMEFGIIMANPEGTPELSKHDEVLIAQCFPKKANFEASRSRARNSEDAAGEPERYILPYRAGWRWLACIGRIELDRFCDPYYRTRYITWAKKLVRLREAHITGVETAMANPVGKKMLEIQTEVIEELSQSKLLGGPGSKSRSSGVTTRKPSLLERAMYIDPAFIETMGLLTSKGFLQTPDFGWFGQKSIPDVLRPFVKSAETEPACR